MTESFYQEDRSIDSNPDIEDWSVRGEQVDRKRQDAINQNIDGDDAAEMAEFEMDLKQYQAHESGFKYQIQELQSLKEKLLPLLKEIKEKEEQLIDSYNWLWSEDVNQYDDPYWDCKTDDEKKLVDLERYYDYQVIIPWINQHAPISIEVEKQKELDEIRRRKEENLKAHKKRLGIEEELRPLY